jgi:hypothetical protein
LYDVLHNPKKQATETVVRRLKILATKCEEYDLQATAVYIREAIPFTQTYRELGVSSCTTSKTERVFRTINDRLNKGSWWSQRGVDAITKLRLDWFYNKAKK